MLEQLDTAADPSVAMIEAVAKLLREFELARDDTVVYLEALLLATRDERYRQWALGVYRSINDRLAKLTARLRDEAIIPGWVDPPAMASLVLSVANGIALQTHLDPTGPGHDALAGQFARLLLAARQPHRSPPPA